MPTASFFSRMSSRYLQNRDQYALSTGYRLFRSDPTVSRNSLEVTAPAENFGGIHLKKSFTMSHSFFSIVTYNPDLSHTKSVYLHAVCFCSLSLILEPVITQPLLRTSALYLSVCRRPGFLLIQTSRAAASVSQLCCVQVTGWAGP